MKISIKKAKALLMSWEQGKVGMTALYFRGDYHSSNESLVAEEFFHLLVAGYSYKIGKSLLIVSEKYGYFAVISENWDKLPPILSMATDPLSLLEEGSQEHWDIFKATLKILQEAIK